jgi:hypothetical protein
MTDETDQKFTVTEDGKLEAVDGEDVEFEEDLTFDD